VTAPPGRELRIGAALFNANHAHLAEELESIDEAGVDFIHMDIVDGYAAPGQGFSAHTIRQLRAITDLPFEAHLVAIEPLKLLGSLRGAGVSRVLPQIEYCPLLFEFLAHAKDAGMQPGIAVAVGTSLQLVKEILPYIDSVLLLARTVGESDPHQAPVEHVAMRVREIRDMIDGMRLAVDLQVAGGLDLVSAPRLIRAGASSVVLGNLLFKSADRREVVASVREMGAAGTTQREDVVEKPSRRWTVVVGSRSFGKTSTRAVDYLASNGCSIIFNNEARPLTEGELLERIPEADVLISGTERVSSRILDAASRLRIIVKHGVGLDNIDLEQARQRGITVRAAGGVVISEAVADLTVGLLLALARHIPLADRMVKSGEWPRLVGELLRGRVLGLVGLGRIGRAVCRRVRAFGMIVIAADIVRDESFARAFRVTYRDLDDLLKEADYISLHVPLTPNNFHIIDARRLRLMKASACIINTARGELVDEEALYEALRSRHIAGAAADVFQQEPPVNSPLLLLDNFVATPHIGAQTTKALEELDWQTARCVVDSLRELTSYG
jgi:ribulose-phosphate 3-epimerase